MILQGKGKYMTEKFNDAPEEDDSQVILSLEVKFG